MSYHHLSLHERYVIHHLKLIELSNREIGRRLGRHHATIGRELARNGPSRPDLAPYWHEAAQRRCDARRRLFLYYINLISYVIYVILEILLMNF